MLNALWVVALILLQANKDTLRVEWPLGAIGPNITFNGLLHNDVHLIWEPMYVDPFGLFFMLFFASVLLFQLVGMLIDRVYTNALIMGTASVRLTLKLWRAARKGIASNLFVKLESNVESTPMEEKKGKPKAVKSNV